MICCGETHSTPFCPHCGKKLEPDQSPQGLLMYLRSRALVIKNLEPSSRLSEENKKAAQAELRKESRLLKAWIEALDLPTSGETAPVRTPPQEKKTAKKRKTRKKRATEERAEASIDAVAETC